MAKRSADRLLLVRDGQAQFLPVSEASADRVAAGTMSLPREDVRELILRDGGRLFVAQADLPALVQAERVRSLERSSVLRAVFGDQPTAAPAQGGMMQWVLVIMSAIILLKVLTGHG